LREAESEAKEGRARTHAEPEVLVHLGCVGDEGVRHGDLVWRAGHREDEGLLGRCDRRAQVSLTNDLVDMAEILRECEGRVAECIEGGFWRIFA
jgi:hypothetical protein